MVLVLLHFSGGLGRHDLGLILVVAAEDLGWVLFSRTMVSLGYWSVLLHKFRLRDKHMFNLYI